MVTTIQIDESTKKKLDRLKEYSRETYNELVEKLIVSYYSYKENQNQYDKFIHEVQKPKMKEIWDNKHDEAWENA